jgi:hypothetical protein
VLVVATDEVLVADELVAEDDADVVTAADELAVAVDPLPLLLLHAVSSNAATTGIAAIRSGFIQSP